MKCITVSYGQVKGKARDYPYFQPAIYESYTTKDGRKLWKYIKHIGVARRSVKLCEKDTVDLSRKLDLLYIKKVRHWFPIGIYDLLS